jgi:hypothetical protein
MPIYGRIGRVPRTSANVAVANPKANAITIGITVAVAIGVGSTVTIAVAVAIGVAGTVTIAIAPVSSSVVGISREHPSRRCRSSGSNGDASRRCRHRCTE